MNKSGLFYPIIKMIDLKVDILQIAKKHTQLIKGFAIRKKTNFVKEAFYYGDFYDGQDGL